MRSVHGRHLTIKSTTGDLDLRPVPWPCQRLMTYPGAMASPRSRNAAQTRADILAAARARFGSDGYERTTLRAVAADVGVDPALVIRYFGSKQDLFAAAAEFTIDLPDLAALHPDDIADALLSSFFAVWEDDTFV